MPRFVQMLYNGFTARGHQVKILRPEPFIYNLPLPVAFKKWLGYIDQYIVFAYQVKKKIKANSTDTLYVFTDHALGPWVPLTAGRYSVIHCHDFLAQQSALGKIPENKTGYTGRLYQQYIRKGYSQGVNFISVSNKTKEDLHHFLMRVPAVSKVVYNGLNQVCTPIETATARELLKKKINLDISDGYLLHVGGNDWYKNRSGVIELYTAWRLKSGRNLPLLLIGSIPSPAILSLAQQSGFQSSIHFLTGVDDENVRVAYSGATLMLFPSLAEGFGWPIAEAMACGCPVVTTSEAPMSEVAGDAGFLIAKKTFDKNHVNAWANEVAAIIEQVVALSPEKRKQVIKKGIENAKRFDTGKALDKIEEIYQFILTENAVVTGIKNADELITVTS